MFFLKAISYRKQSRYLTGALNKKPWNTFPSLLNIEEDKSFFFSSVSGTPFMSHYTSDSMNKVTIYLSPAYIPFLFCFILFIFNMFIILQHHDIILDFFSYSWNTLVLAAS